ncbi:hormogonium polysaccharide biosynthesis protein HpsA [Planktothrix agardhii]|uniref:hormogonium polysaccharide biosynthesis protein HpsA n=1 Tax=Planktothrix agardhii TaxID=1160 RepID=UPI001F2CD125|nr:hormogonium polysaccharide biosynthesis protein HpsA [Planktothrix agardhii]MCF3573739.1 hormogonium polysaccharide biosynthesis protein HpsA [Planktothrix agardhii 1812]MCF3579193.1 hormogonium polysaccharide biosynthesis protein HpsA [Planktothrix agardhii 1811]MCF3582390.1 hormogonium polysaccharide biosynthesis protein HpsA [Planktothrix agardhii 1811]
MFRSIRIAFQRMTRRTMRSLLRVWMRINRQDRYGRAGFVLPTVTMVLLVVVLLTITIMLRSMDRAKMAQYRRVDEQVLQAATPALDRAKAKIKYLLDNPPTLSTPSDSELYRALTESLYTLKDETQLAVLYDVSGNGAIEVSTSTTPFENREDIATAWKFPVDTDNNGKFDTWTIYGIYFRNPTPTPTNPNPARNPLGARTPPYTAASNLKSGCNIEGTSSSLVGGGWYTAGSKLKKAIFTYVVNVPIAETEIAGWNTTKYGNITAEAKATSAVSALEYQQDVSRLPLVNNAVVYKDDLEMAPGGGLRFQLNGRILTNSSLLVTQFTGLRFYQVSSPGSCFFEDPENSKIIVGGEVVRGFSGSSAGDGSGDVDVDLFQGDFLTPTGAKISTANQTVTNTALETLSNSSAYEDRLSDLVGKAPASLLNQITDSIKRNKALRTYFEDRTRKVPYKEIDAGTTEDLSTIELQISGTVVKPPNAWIYPTNINVNDGGKTSKENNPRVNLLTAKGTATAAYRMEASEPSDNEKEGKLGDRILAGNGLPLKWYINNQEVSGSTPQYLTSDGTTKINWTVGAGGAGTSSQQRTRQTRIQELPDVGSTDRDGFWEIVAGTTPKTPDDPYGGLRVVTGAGIYSRNNSFLPPPELDVNAAGKVIAGVYDTSTSLKNPIVWPDTMPMSVAEPITVPPNNTKIGGSKIFDNSDLYDTDGLTPLTTLSATAKEAGDGGRWKPQDTASPTKGDLQMRATVVYHYAQSSFSKELSEEANLKGVWTNVKQTPIACVSNYYDPSTALTAKNMPTLTVDKLDADGNIEKDSEGQVITLPAWNTATGGKSNNGIVYGPPPAEGSYSTALSNQANLVFPDGRPVNPTLALALAATPRKLSEQSAIDAALCAYGIIDGTLKPLSAPPIPHGAIRETAFLDARQIKAIEKDNKDTPTVDETFTLKEGQTKGTLSGSAYDLPLENRQPLEIRATILDLYQLRSKQIAQTTTTGPTKGGQEYLLPLSGVVYASREDALPDNSTGSDIYASSTDSQLDPTRRPNGIMLINGKCLARDTAGTCNPALTGNSEAKIQAITREKGLTLVSNLPVYIKGQFNPHTQEEFTTKLTTNWSNFYARSKSAVGKTSATITKTDRGLNENFACRPGDPRLSNNCATGDNWRPATILSDSVTVVSGSTTAADTQGTDLNTGFRFGFRNEGDFDLRNNAGVARVGYDLDADGSIKATSTVKELTFGLDLNGNGKIDVDTDLVREIDITSKAARMINGFDGYNNFVTNGLTSKSKFDTNDDGTVAETYLDTNYTATGGLNSSYFNNFVTPVQRRSDLPDYVMEMCRKPMVSACSPRDWIIGMDFDGLEVKEDGGGGGYIADINNKNIDLTYPGATTSIPKKPNELNIYEIAVLLPAGNAKIGTQNIKLNLYDWNALKPPQFEYDQGNAGGVYLADRLLSGTTSRPARLSSDQGFPRRVAFLRDKDAKLLTNATGNPASLGVSAKPTGNSTTSKNQDEQHDTIGCFVVDGASITLNSTTVGVNVPGSTNPQTCGNNTPRLREAENSLWFKTVQSGNMSFNADSPLWLYNPDTPSTSKTFTTPTVQSPLLVPVLQLETTTGTAATPTTNTQADKGTSWLMIPDNGPVPSDLTTPYDVVMGTGDVPSRKIGAIGDFNGGLPNLARLLENWQGKTVKISGSFIQFQRSKYATAPYLGVFTGGQLYNTSSTGGQTPYFSQPQRNWGFDVGLLSQSPDLFAQKLTTRSSDSRPAEYFREVSRSDEWVQTLLCAKEVKKEADGTLTPTTTNAVQKTSIRPNSFCTDKTGG